MTGTEIRRRRLALGWSIEDLAARLGVSGNSVYRWETRRARTSRSYLRLLEIEFTAAETALTESARGNA